MKKHLYTSFWAIVSVCMLISQYGFAESPTSKAKLKASTWVSSTSNAFAESETKAPGLSKSISGSFPPVTSTCTASISVSSTATTSVCSGTAIALTANPTGGTYSWASSGAPGAFSNSTNRTPSFTPSGSGISSLTVTVVNSTASCTVTATATVSATQPTLTAGVQSPTGLICIGSVINLTATGGHTSYSWAKNGNAGVQAALITAGFISTTQNPSYTASATNLGGTFSVTVTGTNNCTNSTTVSLSITNASLPAAAIVKSNNDPVPASICKGKTIDLRVNPNASSYSWQGSDGFTSTDKQPATITFSTTGTKNYTVTITAASGCSNTATASIDVLEQPTVLASVSSPVGTICLGSTINLTASGGDTYAWVKNGNATIQQALIDAGFVSSAQNPSYTASATNLGGTFTVTATATNGCSATATTSLSIQNLPAAAIVTQPDGGSLPATICKGQSLQLRANPGGTGTTYSWQGSDGFTSTNRIPTAITFSTTGTKNYTVTVTATTGCSNTATASIEVLELPNPSVSPPQTICAGTPVNLTAGTGMSSYSWVSSSGGFTSASNTLSLGANDVTPGTNYFTVTVTATTGCSATATTSLSVNALPELLIASPTEVCLGATISLDPDGATSYSWNIEHNGSYTSSTADPLSQTYTSSGYYYYTITGMNAASCTSSISFSIQVGPDIQPRYAAICLQGNTLSLSASGGGSYSWAGPNGFSSTLASPTPKASTQADLGIYSVTVTSGINTCTATATVEVYFGAGTITAAPISVCKGSSLQLSASATHGASYRWTKLGSPTVWFGQNPTVTTNMKATNTGLYTVWITGENGCIAKQEVLVTMKICTATRLAADMSGEAEEDIKLTLSENPTNGRMKVSVTLSQESKVQLDWINLNGTKLHGWESSNNQTFHEFDIDVSTSVDGLYLLRASTDTGQKTLRVVKSSDK